MMGLSVIAFLVVLAGVLGGLLAFTIDLATGLKSGCSIFWRAILEGILAAAVVPLFLSVIGNDMVGSMLQGATFAPQAQYAAVKLLGFCLLAAISSRRFLSSASGTILQLREQVKEQARAVDALNQAVFEDEEPTPQPAEVQSASQAVSASSRSVLQSFLKAPIPARSARGLSLTSGLPVEEIERVLAQLHALNLVHTINGPGGPRWALTELGLQTARIQSTEVS